MAVDIKTLGRNDLGALVTGALAVIFTFIGKYLSVTLEAPLHGSTGHNAWDGVGTLGSLLLIVALAIVAARIFASDALPGGVPWNLVAAALAALGTIILIIKGLTFDVDGPAAVTSRVDAGVGWSGWVLFVLAIAFTAFAALSSNDSAEKAPGVGNTPPAPPAA